MDEDDEKIAQPHSAREINRLANPKETFNRVAGIPITKRQKEVRRLLISPIPIAGEFVSRSFYFFFPPQTSPVAPRVGQRVRIEGQPGTYIVLHLHPKRFSADLMSTAGRHEIEEKVPYFAIEPLNEKQSEESRSTEKHVPEESKSPSPARIR